MENLPEREADCRSSSRSERNRPVRAAHARTFSIAAIASGTAFGNASAISVDSDSGAITTRGAICHVKPDRSITRATRKGCASKPDGTASATNRFVEYAFWLCGATDVLICRSNADAGRLLRDICAAIRRPVLDRHHGWSSVWTTAPGASTSSRRPRPKSTVLRRATVFPTSAAADIYVLSGAVRASGWAVAACHAVTTRTLFRPAVFQAVGVCVWARGAPTPRCQPEDRQWPVSVAQRSRARGNDAIWISTGRIVPPTRKSTR